MSKISKIKTGDRIRKLREAKTETQEELAALLKVKRQIISYYENGARVPNLEHLVIIATHYNTTTDYLLGLSDVATTNENLQLICSYTGLDEKSVKRLHYIQKIKANKNNAKAEKISLIISGKNSQNAELDLTFINGFLSSKYNPVFNEQGSVLYDYYRNIECCIALYNQIIDFDINEVDVPHLTQQYLTFYTKTSEIRKNIRINRHLITDDFKEAFKSFASDKLNEIEEKEKTVKEKLILMDDIIIKSAGESNGNNS